MTELRPRRRRKAIGSIGLGLALGVTVLLTQPAAAAVSGSEQWITDVTGSGTAASTITFGTTGVTAALSADTETPAGSSCMGASAEEVPYSTFTNFNAQDFYSPDAPTNAVAVGQCLVVPGAGTNATQRTLQLSKPVDGLIFHVGNLDGSAAELTAGPSSGAIVLTTISKNGALQLTGGNHLESDHPFGGSDCNTQDSATDQPTCGSFRMSEASGPVSSFTLSDTSISGRGNDGWFWSLSFHTATVTPVFSPASIASGAISTLTLTVDNPSDEGAIDFGDVDFTQALPAGVTLADSSLTTTGCGSPSVNGGTITAGATSLAVTAAAVPAGTACTISVHVTAATGSYSTAPGDFGAALGNILSGALATLAISASGGAPAGGSAPSATLPVTGVDPLWVVLSASVASLLVAAGVTAVLIARRRHRVG